MVVSVFSWMGILRRDVLLVTEDSVPAEHHAVAT